MPSSLPTGTLTYLFTDIEGSSALWEQQPEAMQVVLARHDALLRAIIAAHGGQIVKKTGDGLHAVFKRASEGVEAALACQQALLREDWPGISQRLKVRMGLHTGEADLREGDYYGPAVNRAHRLMMIAAGGQTLLSSITAELVNGQLPTSAKLLDLGEQRLRDLARPERVFQLSGPGLQVEFPPLRSLNHLPNNLPLQLTSFVGREKEIAEAKRLLEQTRLLTLTGPGGTGKTRLSLQVAADVLDTFSAGVWWVELAPLSDPALLPKTVGTVLGVREQPDRPLLESLINYLRPKSLLLILDNCEHIIDACAQLAASLLSACPKIKIMPSSREALGVVGETVYRVPSLSLPEIQTATPEALMQSEAVRLFVERAQSSQPGFELTTCNLGTIAQICQRLDGIPLALELAAVRVHLFSIEQIADRLDDRFRLLTGGSRTALPRQQTLRALIDWSYDLLSETERAALNRLSVFVGGWSFEAAEAVLGFEALDLLARLVDKSLVVVEQPGKTGERRYHLLETIRQYARDKLLESGESPAVRDLHLETFLRLALEAERKLDGPEMLVWLDRLDPEQDNLRAALEWAQQRDPRAALQIATSLQNFWRSRGSLLEGRQWLQASLAQIEALAPVEGEALRQRQALLAKGIFADGRLAFAMGELLAARSQAEASSALARQADEHRTLGLALGLLGLSVVWLGDAEAAQAVIEEGLKIAQLTSDKRISAAIKVVQASLAAQIHDDYAAASSYNREIIHILRDELNNPWDAAITIMTSGIFAAVKGDVREALDQFSESERLFRELGDWGMANASLSEQAHVERKLGNFEKALELYSKTIIGWQELGRRPPLAHELECFAFIAIEQGLPERAVRLLGAADALRASEDAPMRAVERIEYDQAVADLHSQLDEAAFAAVWAEGRDLTLDQAVEFALSQPGGSIQS